MQEKGKICLPVSPKQTQQMQASHTHLHSSPKRKTSRVSSDQVFSAGKMLQDRGVLQTGHCVNGIQFYLHRSGSRLHHHFKWKTSDEG